MRVIYGPTPANKDAPDGCPTGESGGNPTASNGGNLGVMQISYPSHRDKLIEVTGSDDPDLLFDPAINIAVGYLVWERSGGGTFAAWSCRP